MTSSKNPPVRQQAGCSAKSASSFPLSCSSLGSRRSCRPLEQIDNVGQDDQAYDGKEHQDENIQHHGVLGRGGLWIPRKCEL